VNLASLLTESARRFPEKPALVLGQRSCNYAALDAASDRTADALAAHGVEPGRKVALIAPNGPEFVAGMMGILRAGAVAVPCSHDLPPSEIGNMTERIDCEYLLRLSPRGDAGSVPVAPFDDPAATLLHLTAMPAAGTRPPDRRLLDAGASNIRFTSGTTAAFKGVVLSHAGIAERISVSNRALRISGQDIVFFGLPMAHHFAASVMLHLSVGATIVTGGLFLGDSMSETIRRHRATVLYSTPVAYRLLAEVPGVDPSALDSVRLAISTAMRLSPDVELAFRRRFGKPLAQTLGIIEVGMPIMDLSGIPGRPDCIGRVIDGFEARIVGEDRQPSKDGTVGELLLRGPGMLEAYCSPWRSRDRILEDGWFRTGDMVRRDEEGNIFLQGRVKHLINVGGNKIFPCEIEQVLATHDAVLEAVVVGVSDEILGEVPSAFVVLRAGMRVTTEALTARCRSRLSHFKIPRHIRIVESLPRTHSGKIAVSALTGN
jgi:long-chain acyl-CoA synthetase